MPEETVVKAPEIGRKIFGATLDYDSAGYYPGIELLNLIFSCTDKDLLPNKEGIERAVSGGGVETWCTASLVVSVG